MAYVIKNNIPEESAKEPVRWKSEEAAREYFTDCIQLYTRKYDDVKVIFRNKPLRGTIRISIDGFYYYVELYKER